VLEAVPEIFHNIFLLLTIKIWFWTWKSSRSTFPPDRAPWIPSRISLLILLKHHDEFVPHSHCVSLKRMPTSGRRSSILEKKEEISFSSTLWRGGFSLPHRQPLVPGGDDIIVPTRRSFLHTDSIDRRRGKFPFEHLGNEPFQVDPKL